MATASRAIAAAGRPAVLRPIGATAALVRPDVPAGPDNRFEPGGDRGQPTHFLTRRHKDVLRVVVPRDFGDRKLVWILTMHGQTQQVAATLNPVWMIDRRRTTRGGNSENINSNTPPVVKIDPAEQTIAESGHRDTASHGHR